jgi:hypothetical protein
LNSWKDTSRKITTSTRTKRWDIFFFFFFFWDIFFIEILLVVNCLVYTLPLMVKYWVRLSKKKTFDVSHKFAASFFI